MVLVEGGGLVRWAARARALPLVPAPYGQAVHLHGEPQRPMGVHGWECREPG